MARTGINVTDESRSVPKTILLLAWPVFLEQILTTLVGFVDTAMVGSLGAAATASVTISNSPIFLLNGVLMALGTGITALTARAVGAGEPEKVQQVVRHALLAMVVIGIPIVSVIIALHRFIPVWMGAAPEIIDTAADYNFITGFGRLFIMTSMMMNACFRGYGDTRTPLKINVAMNLENVVGNYLLIYPSRNITVLGRTFRMWGAGLGVRGAAIATALGMFMAGAIALYMTFHRKNAYRVSIGDIFRRPDTKLSGQIVSISFPSMLERMCMSLAGIISARTIATLGTISIAANSLCLTGESLSFMPAMAFQIAVTTLVGQCLGAKKIDLAKKFIRTTMGIALVTMTFTGIALWIFATPILTFFTPDKEVIAIGAKCLRIIALVQPVQVAGWVFSGVLKGAGDTKMNFYITAFTTWTFRTLLTVIAIRKMGLDLTAAIWVEDIEIIARCLLFYIYYSTGKWKTKMDHI